MRKHVSVADAKARLSDCIRQVEMGDSLFITRHGKAVAAMVSPEDVAHLDRLRKAGPEGGLASLAGGWEGSQELVELINRSPRSAPREVADPE